MDRAALAKLAREDYDQQERAAAALITRMQLATAISGVLGTASITLFRSVKLEALSLFAASVFLACFAGVWGSLVMVGFCIVQAIRVRTYKVPRAMDRYLDWWQKRSAQLKAMNYEQPRAEWYAVDELHGFLLDDYAEAAGINRLSNLGRQEWLSRGSFWVIVAAGVLAAEAAVFVCVALGEVSNGRV